MCAKYQNLCHFKKLTGKADTGLSKRHFDSVFVRIFHKGDIFDILCLMKDIFYL